MSDFVVAKKTDDGKLELVYIIESKGEHLLGNIDSHYKQKILNLMTEQHRSDRIESYQAKQMDLFQVK